MELIFPRSTLARFTPRGVVGVVIALADVGVTGAAVVTTEGMGLGGFVAVLGGFDAASDFVLETAPDGWSDLPSGRGKINKSVPT